MVHESKDDCEFDIVVWRVFGYSIGGASGGMHCKSWKSYVQVP